MDYPELLEQAMQIIAKYQQAANAQASLGLTFSDGVTRSVRLASESERDSLMTFMAALRGDPRHINLKFANGNTKTVRVSSPADLEAGAVCDRSRPRRDVGLVR